MDFVEGEILCSAHDQTSSEIHMKSLLIKSAEKKKEKNKQTGHLSVIILLFNCKMFEQLCQYGFTASKESKHDSVCPDQSTALNKSQLCLHCLSIPLCQIHGISMVIMISFCFNVSLSSKLLYKVS